MAFDLTRSSRTLGQILPFLATEKMRRDQLRQYLENSLTEISAHRQSQMDVAAEEAKNRLAEILGTNYLGAMKDIPGGRFMMPGELKGILPTYTPDVVVPPDAAAKAQGIRNALTTAYTQFQGNETIDPRILNALVTQVSEKIPLDLVTNLQKNKIDLSQQGVTKAGQALTASGQELEKKRIGLEERKVVLEEKNLPGQKDLISQMKEAQNDREAAMLQYGGVNQLWDQRPAAKNALIAKIKYANSRIDTAARGIGFDSPIKTPKEMQIVGISILNRFVQNHEIPNWFTLLEQGYDPDFVFGLSNALEKPNMAVKDPDAVALAKAMAMIQALTQGGEIK